MTDDNILDLTIIAEVKETMGGKFSTMAQYFFEDAEGYVSDIRDGIETSNVEKIVSPAHTLKSSSLQMGAVRLSYIAKDIESLSRTQVSSQEYDIQIFKELFVKLEAAFIETKSEYANIAND